MVGDLRGKRVVVMGLGHFGGGIAVSRFLASAGARILVTDKEPPDKLADSIGQLADLPLSFRLGEHLESDFIDADLIVVSPAVPPHNPLLLAAERAGVPITTEICLFVGRCPASRVLGVTGTKGKSTTTEMLGQLLSTRHRTWVGGNIGRSLLPDLPRISADDLVLLELSSFMLHHLAKLHWSPHLALVTMLAEDHKDWHGSAQAYWDAKRNIVRWQHATDYALLDEQSALAMGMADFTAAQVIPFGCRGRRTFELLLPGAHNQVNAQGAFAAASLFGITWPKAQEVLGRFRGLPHRLELVCEVDGVRYYDDSIATVPEAAVAALQSFPEGRVVQIVGGSDKQLAMEGLCRVLARRAKAVLCIGQTGPAMAAALQRAEGPAVVKECGDLPSAMAAARQIARRGDVVLLSTGFASYGQFVNFQERGERFAELARELSTASRPSPSAAPSPG